MEPGTTHGVSFLLALVAGCAAGVLLVDVAVICCVASAVVYVASRCLRVMSSIGSDCCVPWGQGMFLVLAPGIDAEQSTCGAAAGWLRMEPGTTHGVSLRVHCGRWHAAEAVAVVVCCVVCTVDPK
jgi:hypothetical protein